MASTLMLISWRACARMSHETNKFPKVSLHMKILFSLGFVLLTVSLAAACAPTSTAVLAKSITRSEPLVAAQATSAPSATPAASATPAPPATSAAAAAQDLSPYVTLNLKAGFPLDPFLVSVNGGGSVDASTLAPDCTGYVNSNPTVTVAYTGKSDLVRAFYYSAHDGTLLIKSPDGKYACSDDSDSLDQNPAIEFKQPAVGTYQIWVGSFDKNQLIPGLLVLTARPNLTPATFSLTDLVHQAQANEKRLLLPLLLKAMHRQDARASAVSTDKPLVLENVKGEGSLPAFDLPVSGVICNGFISVIPTAVVNVPAKVPNLAAFFEGAADATLVMVGPENKVWCNDDYATGKNSNPLINVSNPAEGTYAIFVGRINTDQPVSGKLTVTTAPGAAPGASK